MSALESREQYTGHWIIKIFSVVWDAGGWGGGWGGGKGEISSGEEVKKL